MCVCVCVCALKVKVMILLLLLAIVVVVVVVVAAVVVIVMVVVVVFNNTLKALILKIWVNALTENLTNYKYPLTRSRCYGFRTKE